MRIALERARTLQNLNYRNSIVSPEFLTFLRYLTQHSDHTLTFLQKLSGEIGSWSGIARLANPFQAKENAALAKIVTNLLLEDAEDPKVDKQKLQEDIRQVLTSIANAKKFQEYLQLWIEKQPKLANDATGRNAASVHTDDRTSSKAASLH